MAVHSKKFRICFIFFANNIFFLLFFSFLNWHISFGYLSFLFFFNLIPQFLYSLFLFTFFRLNTDEESYSYFIGQTLDSRRFRSSWGQGQENWSSKFQFFLFFIFVSLPKFFNVRVKNGISDKCDNFLFIPLTLLCIMKNESYRGKCSVPLKEFNSVLTHWDAKKFSSF